MSELTGTVMGLQEATLKEWVLTEYGGLAGKVYGHPRFDDGTFVSTSTLRYINKEKNIAVTHNTVYFLEGAK